MSSAADKALPPATTHRLGLDFLSAEQRETLRQTLRLSRREAMVVDLALSDLSEATIALTLGISRHTVHTHLDRIYQKLRVHSRCQLALRLFRTYAGEVTRSGPNI
jgi:DNA-binding CsgD family transcriptional regulator